MILGNVTGIFGTHRHSSGPRALPGPEMGAQSTPQPGCSTWLTQLFVGSLSLGWNPTPVGLARLCCGAQQCRVPAIPSADICSLIAFQHELIAMVQGAGVSISP